MKRIYTSAWQDYQLLDAGHEKKLERFGNVITIRPDKNAYFKAHWSIEQWHEKAHFEFIEQTKSSGIWKPLKTEIKNDWQISYNQLTINLHLTNFKHIGIFPEQRVNWDYIAEHLGQDDRFLNLFAYTGVASLVAKQQGAEVYHCDSVRQIISWAKENMLSSHLSDIHWVLEDALKFAAREVKRGKKYQGIIMDPPAFGLGANKQRWKIEHKFAELLTLALALRSDKGFIITNTYSPRLDTAKIKQISAELINTEKVEVKTLSVKSQTGKTIDYGQRTLITE